MSARTRSPEMYEKIAMDGPGGKPVQFRLLANVSHESFEVQVLASPDFMSVYLCYGKRLPGHEVTEKEIRAILAKAGVVHGIESELLRLLVVVLNGSEPRSELFEAARGTPARNGHNGRIEFFVRPASHRPHFEADETGKIDYRTLNLIANARKDQHVATLHKPTRGRPGRNVLGDVLPVQDGKAITVRIGDGIRGDPETGRFFALDDGYIQFEKGKIALRTKYEVRGDVDYKVGNIDFVGEVLVGGNVLDDFHVAGGKGLVVNGNVGNGTLRSDANVVVHGGMAGRGEGRIEAGGSVRAKYLNDVRVEAKGDVMVQNEMVNCHVYSLGRVAIPDGAAIGGEVVAFRGVLAGALGSDLGVNTDICAGLDWSTEQEVDEIDTFLRKTTGRLEEIEVLTEPYLADRMRLAALSEERKKLLRQTLLRLRNLREAVERAARERETARASKHGGRTSQVNVRKILHPGVRIRLPKGMMDVKDAIRGPLSVVEEKGKKDKLRVVPQFTLTPDEKRDGGKGDAPAR